MIEIKDLYKKFGDREILKGVDLTIKTGETLVIIGRSGCGKSVLLKNLMGLILPDKGSIVIDETEVVGCDEKGLSKLRMRFGMLFQGAALFDSLTVWENVGFSILEHTKEKKEAVLELVKERLRWVGLKDVEFHKPAELSGGMQKRVGLARAIANDPEYMLYDEPTTGLDPIMCDAINHLIIDMQKKLNMTSIVVTHDMVSAYTIADRIAMLYEGRIIFEGTVEETKNSDNPYVQQFINGQEKGPISLV